MKIIHLSGDIGWEINQADFRRQLPENNEEDVQIYLYSPGGYVDEGLEIYNIIRDYPGHVTVICGALVASSATLIACAADNVITRNTSRFMIHEPWSFAIGCARDMSKAADILRGVTNIMVTLYAFSTGKDEEIIRKDVESEKWLVGKEVVDYGFADEIEPSGEGITTENAQNKISAVKNRMEFDSGAAFSEAKLVASVSHAAVGLARNNRYLKSQCDNNLRPPIIGNNNKAKETKKMTKDELEAQYPALCKDFYSAGKAEGVTEERDRVEALFVFADLDLEKVRSCVSEGRSLSKKELAEIQLKQMNIKELKKMDEDSKENEGEHSAPAPVSDFSPEAQAIADKWGKGAKS